MRAAPLLVAATLLVTGCGSTVQVKGSQTVGGGTGLDGGSGGQLGGAAGTTGTGSTGLGGTTGATSGSGFSGSTGGTTGGTSGVVGPGGAGGTTGGGASGAGTVGGGSAASIPASGPGWDAKTITIGITTQKDVQTVAQSAGVNSVDSGDQEADVKAVLADVNARGGLFGRTVKPLFFDTKTTGDPETQAQAACETFTKDNHVVAVYAMALAGDTPSFRTCLSNAHVPVLAGGGQAFDDKVFNDLKGYYSLMPFPSYTRFVPHFVDRLVAQQFFSPWDNANGKPGVAPVKVGFLCPDTPIGRRVGALVTRELTRVHRAPTNATYYSTTNADVSAYVLKFRSDGITHVLFCDLGLFVFAEQAESQHYRPRYGVSTFNTPILFLQGVVPEGQLTGAVGSGFDPTLDVDQQHDPGDAVMPAAARCRAVGAKHGVSYAQDRRFARAVLYDTCDILTLIVSAAQAVNALDGPAIKQGIELVGSKQVTAVTFAAGLSATVHANPAATRDIYYDSAQHAFRYRGPTLRMG